jgi:hypothetical protein
VKPSLLRLIGLAWIPTACAIGLGYAGEADPAPNVVPGADSYSSTAVDYSSWAVNPTAPGPDLPPVGRSLFDHLVTERTEASNTYLVPFPLSALIDRIRVRLSQHEYNGGTRLVMIPMGRSLQRMAAAPDFFRYPRIVFAVIGEPATNARDAGALLKDRLYIGYVEKTGVLEVISYNEAAGRFEFQLVKDYRAGARPRIFYANRAICISCHQNHAPIFSKAIWGESNANGRVAELLRSQRADFDLSAQANIDFPDDIDKATVRANTLVSLQSVWQKGCLDPQNRSLSQRCRAAAFTAVLQYGLSGEQDFDSGSPSYQSDFVSTFSRTWHRTWPQGLYVAQSSLPDRNPFGGSVSSYGGGGSGELSLNWIAASHVPAELDPLNPRPAREIWRFAGALDAYRFITGWAKFFAADDFRALDDHLMRQGQSDGAQRSVYQGQCTGVRGASGAGGFKLQCASDASVAQGVHLAGRFDDIGSGRIDWFNFGPAGQVRDVLLDGSIRRVGSEYRIRAVPKRKGLDARLPDGRALESIEIRWLAETPEAKQSRPLEARVEVIVIDDFALARQAVDRLLAKQPSLFDGAPLARASLMRALFSELGMTERSWCCLDDVGMPPATLDPPEVSASVLARPELQPFIHYCAMCHLTNERFPPNFLSGDPNKVAENLRQCAPRILVRLSAWQAQAGQRVKSPMPPETALPALGMTTRRWARGEDLELLRSYVEELSRREGKPSDVDELLKDGYEALPRCIPEETR